MADTLPTDAAPPPSELAEDATRVLLPEVSPLPKPPSKYTVAGHPTGRVDAQDIVTGADVLAGLRRSRRIAGHLDSWSFALLRRNPQPTDADILHEAFQGIAKHGPCVKLLAKQDIAREVSTLAKDRTDPPVREALDALKVPLMRSWRLDSHSGWMCLHVRVHYVRRRGHRA
ncbi:isoquinoline 1-oxidoreductase subunit beta [Corallococcus coralloides]|uniref:Isoquinoline 1-oxidoreductase subunit beta n=1 Tax=Corallococcus coralloides TaxID=184914 RepID=A0A410RM31_CORCK|nr:hypothetical protein [Corallococcus coralloides]QAT82994.1 isoquinoline 1-oxidoreductase subunit beta [Corallococcus coralloides]